MLALHRLNLVWAILAAAVATYNLAMTGTHPLLTLVGLAVATVPVFWRSARLPDTLVAIWFAFWAVALMVLDAPDRIDALAVFLLGTPALFRVGWWIIEGAVISFVKKK